MYLYVYEGYCGGREGRKRTEELIRRAAREYIKEEDLRIPGDFDQILRTPKGKPYFSHLPLEFSVSHTGDLWVCLIADADFPVGVDVQSIRKCHMDKIAKRYYTWDEQEFVSSMGEEGFFQIWTRKEAYAKFTGKGITEELAFFSTLKEGSVEFVDFNIRAGVKGSCCMKEKRELWIRTLM